MTEETKRRLIAANEFTPKQLGGAASAITWLLNRSVQQVTSQKELAESVRLKWFSESAATYADPDERRTQQLKRAANVVTGMRQYGLLGPDRDVLRLTNLGSELLDLLREGSIEEAADRFSVHLLNENSGVDLLRAADAVRKRNGSVTGERLAEELRFRGFDIPNNNAAAGKMRQWLEWSGVVDDQWRTDNARLRSLAGFGLDELNEWLSLSWSQRAFLEALHDASALSGRGWLPAKDVLALLDERSVRYDRAQAKKTIYDPLVTLGWVELKNSSLGRGSKGGDIRQTEKSVRFEYEQAGLLRPDPMLVALQSALNRDLQSILTDLSSDDTGVKGLALEVLSARIAQDLGLVPRKLRVKGSATGGAEVDLLAERTGFSFERWTVQCKNQQAAVSVGVVAKEAGVAAVMRSSVILIVTTSGFTKAARDFARSINTISATQIMLVDRAIVEDYARRGAGALQDHVHRLAQEVGRHKSLSDEDLISS